MGRGTGENAYWQHFRLGELQVALHIKLILRRTTLAELAADPQSRELNGRANRLRLHANKAELLRVLLQPETPVHIDSSENDIRCQAMRTVSQCWNTQLFALQKHVDTLEAHGLNRRWRGMKSAA